MNDTKQQIKSKVKKHIPKDWLCDLRIAYRITMEAFNDIKRTGIMNLIIITTMAAILTIFGVLFRTSVSMSQFAHELGNVLEISVYLKQGANVEAVSKKISEFDNVVNINVIKKEISWRNMRKEMDLPNMSNPLPDTLHVKVKNPTYITAVLNQIRTVPEVEDTGYADDLAKKVQFFTHIISTTTFFVTIIVVVLTMMIINNTIQLVIQARKKEIEIMRLMGVSNWYIKIPLIMQGAFYGFVGALIAIIPIDLVENSLGNVHKFFLVPSPPFAELFVVVIVLLLGILFGASGSFISIKKHIQV